MMEYRKLPHGNDKERFSVIGLGMGGIGKTPTDEIESIIRKAIDKEYALEILHGNAKRLLGAACGQSRE